MNEACPPLDRKSDPMNVSPAVPTAQPVFAVTGIGMLPAPAVIVVTVIAGLQVTPPYVKLMLLTFALAVPVFCADTQFPTARACRNRCAGGRYLCRLGERPEEAEHEASDCYCCDECDCDEDDCRSLF